MPDGSWAVDLPAEEVPPEMPEPSLGYAISSLLLLAEVVYTLAKSAVLNQLRLPAGSISVGPVCR